MVVLRVVAVVAVVAVVTLMGKLLLMRRMR